MVQSGLSPNTWQQFCESINRQFVPSDYVCRARDRFRRLKETGSVCKYLSEFRNITFTLPGVTEGGKLDTFAQSL